MKEEKLILKVVGGLGNRMRAIDSAITLSSQEKRKLKVIWIKDEDLNCGFNKLFQQSDQFELIELNGSNKVLKGIINNLFPTENPAIESNKLIKWFKTLLWLATKKTWGIKGNLFYNDILDIFERHFQYPIENIQKAESTFYNEVKEHLNELLTTHSVYISACWRLLGNIRWYNDFTIVDSINKKVDELIGNYNHIIGLHIRRTDHKESIRLSPLDKFKGVIDAEINKNPKVVFFLATDCNTTEQELKLIYKSRIITQDGKVFDRNSEKGIQNALIDMYCLSKTKKIYGSHGSSFSHVAADISKINLEVIQ